MPETPGAQQYSNPFMKPATTIKWLGLGVLGLIILPTCYQSARLYSHAPDAFVSHLFHLFDHRYKAFHALFLRISPGMSRHELTQTVKEVYPKQGPRNPPRYWVNETNRIVLFMHAEGHPEPDCEAIFLQLDNGGNITTKGYSAD